MRRVLIISPHFPPVNAPDHQRVRMALPYFAQAGWQASVVAVLPERVEAGQDAWLVHTLPKDVCVTWADAWPARIARRFGVGQLGYRAWQGLCKAAEARLCRDRFDLVFFSTTQNPFMALGRHWLRRFGVPFVLDIQDPWWSDYYDRNPGQSPPGGWFKYSVAQWLARQQERASVSAAAAIVCVSPGYVAMLRQRYPEVTEERFTVLPFGAPEQDFATLQAVPVRQSLFDPHDGKEHWVYVGRGGADMAFAAKAFFLALRQASIGNPELDQRVRVHFAGTDYAPAHLARKTIEPLAKAAGVGHLVSELTTRLPYGETLQCLREAAVLFMLGSDDPTYSASKLYPYVLARKPLLAVFHRQSSVGDIIRSANAGTLVAFDAERTVEEVAAEIGREWFARWPHVVPDTNWSAFAPFTARSMTSKLCDVFERARQSGQRTPDGRPSPHRH